MNMSKKAKILVLVSWAVPLVVICVLSCNLYETHKWNDIYFRHMMQAESELDRVRVIDFTDQRFGADYKIRISRDEVKIEPVAESHSVTIPNPLYNAPPTSKAE
jgi:hypothetical protein